LYLFYKREISKIKKVKKRLSEDIFTSSYL
jgi:hypothetical protein